MTKSIRIFIAAFLCITTLVTTGCASIVNGTEQAQTFNSVPRGAQVKIDGQNFGKAPVTASLSRKQNHNVEVSIPGYQPANFDLEQKVSGWYFGNIAFGGLIGLVVDYTDGAMYKLEPSHMKQMNDSYYQSGKKNTITVMLAKNIPREMKKNKVGQLHRQV